MLRSIGAVEKHAGRLQEPKRFKSDEQNVTVVWQLPPQSYDVAGQAVNATLDTTEPNNFCLGASVPGNLESRYTDGSCATIHDTSTVSLPLFHTAACSMDTLSMTSEYSLSSPSRETSFNQGSIAERTYFAASRVAPHYSHWSPTVPQSAMDWNSQQRYPIESMSKPILNDIDVHSDSASRNTMPWKPNVATHSHPATEFVTPSGGGGVDDVFARGQWSPSYPQMVGFIKVGVQHGVSNRNGSVIHQQGANIGPTADKASVDSNGRESASQYSDKLRMLISTAETASSLPKVPNPQSSTMCALPFALSCPADKTNLATFQVYLRLHIEVFAATADDVFGNTRGRNRRVRLHQVGLRCRHCAQVPSALRAARSTYFPLSTLGIYQSAQNMSSVHLQCGRCPQMPDAIKMVFAKLMCTKGRGSMTKSKGREYWSHHALQRGLVNTEDGIFPSHLAPAHTNLDRGRSPSITSSTTATLPISSSYTGETSSAHVQV